MLFFFKVAEYEATTFSIFYNNSLFLAIVILASFYLLRVRLKFYYIYALFRIRIWIRSGFNRVRRSGLGIWIHAGQKLSPKNGKNEEISWSQCILVWIRFQQNAWSYVLSTQTTFDIGLRIRNFVILLRQVFDSPGT